MTRPPETVLDEFVVYGARDRRACDAVRSRWPQVSEENECCFARCSPPGEAPVAAQLEAEGLTVSIRYLDRYYLVQSADAVKSDVSLAVLFFDRIASEYDSIVDIGCNRHNADILLSLLERANVRENAGHIVDFGCGTGLALEVATARGIALVGVDACPKMRAVARARGMSVYAPEEVQDAGTLAVSGIFGSYVFHILERPDELLRVWSLLPPTGVLVANFHKGRNIDRVSDWLATAGAVAERIGVGREADRQRHGTYVRYSKRDR